MDCCTGAFGAPPGDPHGGSPGGSGAFDECNDLRDPGIINLITGFGHSGVGRYALCRLMLWIYSAFCSCCSKLA